MIKAFCCFYNEAALIPFFLSHYHFVSAIHAIVTPSIDNTRELLAADRRVTIEDVEMPDGIDDMLKSHCLNGSLAQPDPDHPWHLMVDADELFWPVGDPGGLHVREALEAVPPDQHAVFCRMFNAYRHESDADLDVTSTPVVCQRRHGTMLGPKPSLVRSNRGAAFAVGHHSLVDPRPVPTAHEFYGAHWQNADPSFAVARRVRDRAQRLSKLNQVRGYGYQYKDLTEEDVRQELDQHRHDPAQF